MPRIFDCFPFFNELDLLEIRLNELDPVVDRFVICEAPLTFKGMRKPLYFSENRERFEPFIRKIVHVVIDDMPSGPDEKVISWKRERFQRNALRRGLSDATADDLVIVSDLDEIPQASAVERAANHQGKPTVFSFEMTHSQLFVNLKRSGRWNKARMSRLGDIRKLETLRAGGPTWRPNHPRILQTARQWKRMSFGMRRLRPWVVVPDGGWHFSYMNGPEFIAQKLHAINNELPESQTSSAAATEWIGRALDEASQSAEAGDNRVERISESYPAHLVANQAQFSHLIADRQTFEGFGLTAPSFFV
jgi:beta-1,4-mannosyl-glycoprotein beta-1,4-N-acetylglucosaminyltransferase